MTTVRELLAFVGVGLLGTNAIPHFVEGIAGRRHMTPFGSDSGAVTNVLWGSANAAAAVALAWTHRDAVGRDTLAAAFLSGVALAVGLASFWSAEDPRLPWE